jgi:hypothetical protein
MRVPELDQYARFFQAVGIFIAGGIVGAAIYMGIHQQLFNTIWLENYAYKEKIKELQEDSQTLRKLRDGQGAIAKVNIRIESEEGRPPLDTVTQKELEAKIRSDLKFLVGKKSSDLQENPDVYKKLLASKIYFGIQGKDYRVDVHALFLSGTQLTYWVKVRDNMRSPTVSDSTPP